MTQLLLIVRLAMRSIVAHRVKSVVVGGLLLCGTYAVVLGNALLDSVESSMEQVITGSLAGQLQVYAADARDPLALFGALGLGSTDIGEIPRFEDVAAALEAIDHVAAVVPMGITSATVFGRNDIDQVLSDLRDTVGPAPSPEDLAHRTALLARARRIVAELAAEAAVQEAVTNPELFAQSRDALAEADSEAFWARFDTDPLAALDFLDSKVAPLASDGRLLYLRVIGTDPDKFTKTFDRFRIVKGTAIPSGRPGFLFSNRTYEELVKNPVAAELDRICRAVTEDGKSIAADPLLQQRVARNARQYRRITFQLDPVEVAALEPWLREQLPGTTGGLDQLVQAYLTVDDTNVAARHAGFTERIAPAMDLYEVPVGSTITLRGFTKSGYLKAMEVPVYGTYEFEGLEGAGLQSAANLADLVTFRELYGKMSDRAKDELAGIRASVGVADVSRDDAEMALFGGGAPVEATAERVEAIDIDIGQVVAEDPWKRTFPVEDLEHGLALNAAIVLDDPATLPEVRPRIEEVAKGLGLQVVDWKTASGTIGQFVTVMRGVLITALVIIFLVALIIVNNAMVMATIDRVPEIGTLRAIGAQRTTVLGLFLTETALLGLFAGGTGALAAVLTVWWFGVVGIPAKAQILVLLFGGPRLYPSVGLDDVAFGLLAITGVAVASTLYPALMAARVPPIVAMQGRE